MFLPTPGEFLSGISENSNILLCHQPGFWNPGVAVKFFLHDLLPEGRKSLLFLDTDRARAKVKVPATIGSETVYLIRTNEVMSELPTPPESDIRMFFGKMVDFLRDADLPDKEQVLERLENFRDLFLSNAESPLLKETMAESFLNWARIDMEFGFISDILRKKTYQDFVKGILENSKEFRNQFNQILDDYRDNFRFRYRNYPFPKLKEGEMPFWIVRENSRDRMYKKDLEEIDFELPNILPRAVTLTLYLRMHESDAFIHGVGGGNYEWVGDRLMERFFNLKPPPYAVISGTFHLTGTKERDLPYFLYSKENLREKCLEKLTF